LGQAQQALLGNISDALAAMSAAQNAFDQPKTPPQLGSDPVIISLLAFLISCYLLHLLQKKTKIG